MPPLRLPPEEAGAPPGQPLLTVTRATQVILLAGFGGLIAMMALAGIDSIMVLRKVELTTGNGQLAAIFDSFRSRLIAVLAVSLTLGLALAAGATHYLARLARGADARFREIVGAQHELKELSARLLERQEQERRTLSRELHDEVGQSLSAVLMEIGNVMAIAPPHLELRGHLESIKKLAENSVSVVRNMSLLLRPSMLDDLGLVPALEWQAREVAKRTGIAVHVTAGDVADSLPEEHKTCIYRVVQEALHNCSRHAAARSVSIKLTGEQDGIRVIVKDDGRGFDTHRVRGMGLLGMEERVTHLGGRFQLQSEPGKGTLLDVELPLIPASAETTA